MPQHRFVITREEKSAFGQTFPLSDIVKPVLQCCLGCSKPRHWSRSISSYGLCVCLCLCVLLQIYFKSPFLKLPSILIYRILLSFTQPFLFFTKYVLLLRIFFSERNGFYWTRVQTQLHNVCFTDFILNHFNTFVDLRNSANTVKEMP